MTTGRTLQRLLSISTEETSFAKRGFHCADSRTRHHLEEIGAAFLTGYHAALGEGEPAGLATRLAGADAALAGFAYEGAAMALALLDGLTPWRPGRRSRIRAFLDGCGSPHVYMVHVGVGWALARLPWPCCLVPARPLDPLLRWLAIDGYGFHEGYFHPTRYLGQHASPARVAGGYGHRAFDQGLGRALWFVDGADVERIAADTAVFPQARQADLWSGIGLAAAYAGGADPGALEALRDASEPFHAQMAQGAAFAAKARVRAGNVTAATEAAVQALTGASAAEAAAVTDQSLGGLAARGGVPAYEVWRLRIQAYLATHGARHG
jgi:hypothetical protein